MSSRKKKSQSSSFSSSSIQRYTGNLKLGINKDMKLILPCYDNEWNPVLGVFPEIHQILEKSKYQDIEDMYPTKIKKGQYLVLLPMRAVWMPIEEPFYDKDTIDKFRKSFDMDDPEGNSIEDLNSDEAHYNILVPIILKHKSDLEDHLMYDETGAYKSYYLLWSMDVLDQVKEFETKCNEKWPGHLLIEAPKKLEKKMGLVSQFKNKYFITMSEDYEYHHPIYVFAYNKLHGNDNEFDTSIITKRIYFQ